MALFYPDILEHNNPNNPLMDDGQLGGSMRVVADKDARNAIPEAKRKVGAVVAWIEDSIITTFVYIGADTGDSNWQNDANWKNVNYPDVDLNIEQTLTSNTTTTFVIGTTSYGTITLNYQIIRGDAVAMGTIQVVQNGAILEDPVTYSIREINSIGLVAITSAFNGSNIELTIELDGSDPDDGIMIYDVENTLFPV